jgi:diguanylate cyclase (GGDEF)-like protein
MSSRLHLTRAYSLRSLIGIVIIALVLVGFYRHISVANLKAQETSFNVSIARSLSATLWPYYAEFVREARIMPGEALAATPQFQAMHRTITDRMRGLRVIRIKIYDTDGRIVFSTDPAQIGEIRADSPAFARVLKGEPSSELTLRGRGGSSGDVEDVDVLSSWIPIRRDEDSPVEGGFEIFSDVTAMVQDIERTSYTIVAGVTALLLLLYAFLLAVVRRADRLIAAHEEADRHRQQTRMEYLTRYDALTDLPNRSHFMDLLTEAVNRARRGGDRLGIIYLAVDRFKLVNDSLGHEYGDRTLIEFARRLRSTLGEEPVIGRMGGDQFAVFDRSLGVPRNARAVAENLLARCAEPMEVGGREIVLTASLGLAALGPGAEDAETLVENAISAMRKAKRAGRNGYVVFAPEPGTRPHERLDLEMDLRRALGAGQFVLHYQPRVDTRSGRVSALEALLRWHHPDRGLLMPTEFVPLIEDMDLMVPVGAWVLEEACRQTRAWHDAGHNELRISVNVSLRQFLAGSLVETVRSTLESSGLSSGSLELEITESVLADDLATARTVAGDLRALGVQIAIDDFGTGYSSLSYLVHFPVDCLKIDRMFVADLPHDRGHVALVKAVAAMAAGLGLVSVAEGVENRDQYELLRELGYAEVQGYWLGSPWFAEEVPERMQALALRRLGSEQPPQAEKKEAAAATETGD